MKKKKKNERIINTYFNEKHHGTKQTNICGSEITL